MGIQNNHLRYFKTKQRGNLAANEWILVVPAAHAHNKSHAMAGAGGIANVGGFFDTSTSIFGKESRHVTYFPNDVD